MEPAIILFSFLIVVGNCRYSDIALSGWKYKKQHPEEQE